MLCEKGIIIAKKAGRKMKTKELVKRIKLPAKASIYYLMASAVGKIVSFIITPFSTRLLGKEDFGQFSLYMAILGGVSVLCSAITSSSAIYKGLKNNEKNRGEYLRSVLTVNVVFFAIVFVFLLIFLPYIKLKPFLLIPMTAQILCDGIVAVLISSKRFDYKYKSVTVVAVISAVLPPTMSIFILKRWGGGFVVRIYTLLFVSLCLAIYALSRLLKGGLRINKRQIGYVIKTSSPLFPHSISSAISAQADKLFITWLMGAGALAKYSVVYSLGIALQFTVVAIGSAMTPWIIRRLDRGDIKAISDLVVPMVIGYCALSLLLITVSPEAMLILAPKEYSDALPAILPIALSTPFYFVSTVTTVGITYSGKGSYTVIISTISTILCVILNYMLIGKFGFIGAGTVTLICQSLTALLGAAFLKKVRLGRIISLNKILVPCLATANIGLAIYLLRQSIIARATMLILPMIMLIYCLKKASELVLEKSVKNAP